MSKEKCERGRERERGSSKREKGYNLNKKEVKRKIKINLHFPLTFEVVHKKRKLFISKL